MRPWKVAVVVGALAAVGLLAAVAIASGADRQLVGGDRVAACDGSQGAGRARDAGGRGFGASEAMRAWQEHYADDPYGTEAQAALDALREQYQAENRAGDRATCAGDLAGSSGRGGDPGYGRGGGMMCGGDEW